MKSAIFLLCLFACLNSHSQSNLDKIISKYLSFHAISELEGFKGFKETQGVVLKPVSGANYCVAVSSKKGYNIVALEWGITSKKMQYKLLDTIHVGYIKPKQIIVLGMCRLNKKNDDKIVALAKIEDNEYFKKVFKAWRVNLQTHRFESIPVKNIDCINEDFGAD